MPVRVLGGPRGITAGDFDGNGTIDLATSNYRVSTASILSGDGTGGFSISATIEVDNRPETIIGARLNNDIALDLVTTIIGGDTLTLLTSTGRVTFQSPPMRLESDRGSPWRSISVAMAWTTLSWQITAFIPLTVVNNEGGGRLRNMAVLSNAELKRPLGIVAADVDNDDNVGLVTSALRSNTIVVFRGSDTPFVFNNADELFYDTGSWPVGIAAEDLDNDGNLDLLTTAVREDALYVYRSFLSNPGMIIDHNDPGAMQIGTWTVSTAPQPFGADALCSRPGGSFEWSANLSGIGMYDTYLWWTSERRRSNNVEVTIRHANGLDTVRVDQTSGTGFWHLLGRFEFGNVARVSLTAPSDGSTASADAVRFVPVPAPTIASIVQK